MAAVAFELVAIALVLAVLLFHGVVLGLAAQMPRLDPTDASSALPAPRVSAIIAARNEEREIGECLDTLLAQEYPNLQVIVVDGGSTDATREIALQRGPRVTVIEEPPLPPGWVGKNWACDVGFRAADGEYLLFTDADVRYHPGAVRATVEWAIRERADLATLAPRVEAVTFWEKVVLPFYIQMVLTYFRTPRVNRDNSATAMANGQYLLVRRASYVAVGGHQRIRGAVLEDVRLAQEFRKASMRLRVAWSPDLLVTRMYRDRHEMFEGLLKNVHGTRFSAARQFGFLAALVGLFWVPLLALPYGLLTHNALWTVLGAVLVIALFGKHVAWARAIRGAAWTGLLYPVAVGFYVALIVASLARGLARRPLVWKGRAYPEEAPTP